MLIKLNTSNGEVWINPSLVKSVWSSTDDGKTVVVLSDDVYYTVVESIQYVIDVINDELGRRS